MSIVRYKENEIPPLTPEYIAEVQALTEKIAKGEVEVDCSDIPESDEFDSKYSVPLGELLALNDSQRSELFRKMLAAKEADRAAKKARQEAEQAITEARLLATPITN